MNAINTIRQLILIFLVAFPLFAHSDFTPDSDFIDNQDGTVTHRLTGLSWKRCSEGQSWTGSTCNGTAAVYDAWGPQINSSFAGYSDWRLPTPWELASIVDYDVPSPGPSINTSIFPATPGAGYRTNHQLGDIFMLPEWHLIDFSDGHSVGGIGDYRVRLVRGGRIRQNYYTTPPTYFIDNQDGTVTHKTTGLTWMRCSLGGTWSGWGCSGASNRYADYEESGILSLSTATAGFSYAGESDWRIPTIQELASIVEIIFDGGVAANEAVFPGTQSYYDYWSSTKQALNAGSGETWAVSFWRGEIAHHSPGNQPGYLRLVRGNQSPVPDIGYLENPVLNTTESGIGMVSGWHCSASQIQVVIDGNDYGFTGNGTNRFDTEPICGHHKTGFSRLINWNVYEPGEHTISIYVDGHLFETRKFSTTMSADVPFATGIVKSFQLPDFPTPGKSATLTWNESKQAFVVTDISQ